MAADSQGAQKMPQVSEAHPSAGCQESSGGKCHRLFLLPSCKNNRMNDTGGEKRDLNYLQNKTCFNSGLCQLWGCAFLSEVTFLR